MTTGAKLIAMEDLRILLKRNIKLLTIYLEDYSQTLYRMNTSDKDTIRIHSYELITSAKQKLITNNEDEDFLYDLIREFHNFTVETLRPNLQNLLTFHPLESELKSDILILVYKFDRLEQKITLLKQEADAVYDTFFNASIDKGKKFDFES